MLALEIQRDGKTLSMDCRRPSKSWPANCATSVFTSMRKIPQSEFTLRQTNELGEHFMKLIKPENNLQRIAWNCLMPSLIRKPRQTMEDLIRADRFRNFGHVADYTGYGPDALDGLMRPEYNGQSIVLPVKLMDMYTRFGAERPMGLIRLSEVELYPVSDLDKYPNCVILSLKTIAFFSGK